MTPPPQPHPHHDCGADTAPTVTSNDTAGQHPDRRHSNPAPHGTDQHGTDQHESDQYESDQHGSDRGGHDGHSHGVSADADRRWLTVALALIVAFMAGEVLVGWWARSLALLSDAAHMLTDAGAISLVLGCEHGSPPGRR